MPFTSSHPPFPSFPALFFSRTRRRFVLHRLQTTPLSSRCFVHVYVPAASSCSPCSICLRIRIVPAEFNPSFCAAPPPAFGIRIPQVHSPHHPQPNLQPQPQAPCSTNSILAQSDRQRAAAALAVPSSGPRCSDCPICQDQMKQMASLGCGHVFCFTCIQSTQHAPNKHSIWRPFSSANLLYIYSAPPSLSRPLQVASKSRASRVIVQFAGIPQMKIPTHSPKLQSHLHVQKESNAARNSTCVPALKTIPLAFSTPTLVIRHSSSSDESALTFNSRRFARVRVFAHFVTKCSVRSFGTKML